MSAVVEGLEHFLAACRAAASPEAYRSAQREVADIVEQGARTNARSRQMARSVRSNKTTIGATDIEIRIGGGGGDGVWAIGAQYGSSAFHQFPRRRANGYTVVPAVKQNIDRIGEKYADALLKEF